MKKQPEKARRRGLLEDYQLGLSTSAEIEMGHEIKGDTGRGQINPAQTLDWILVWTSCKIYF